MTTLGEVRHRAERDARASGYRLNPDPAFLNDLLRGLVRNQERYGYPSCPCRLASANLDFDRDIICPCDYRDPDVEEFGTCYCGLYVRKNICEGKGAFRPIPERRPLEKQERAYHPAARLPDQSEEPKPEAFKTDTTTNLKLRIWFCRQCGYMCFREDPPYTCPICKAKKEMFGILETKLLTQ